VTPSRFLGAAAVVLGGLAAVAGSPYRSAHGAIDVAALAADVANERDHVTALELAQWIRDRKPQLHVLDLRTKAEYLEYSIPGAAFVPLESLASLTLDRRDTLVLYSGGGAHAAQGWVMLRALGYSNVFFLRGGLNEWLDEVAAPTNATDLTRYFGGTARPKGSPAPTVAELRRRGC